MVAETAETFLTIDENVFYRLLKEEQGTVKVDVAHVGEYLVPYVSFTAAGTIECIPKGLILRNHRYLLAARTMGDLLHILQDMTGQVSPWNINLSTH